MRATILIILILIIIPGCIEKVVFETNSDEGPVVIYGFVSNEEGATYVTVGRSVAYQQNSFNAIASIPILNAVVTIEDDLGNIFDFESEFVGEHRPVDSSFKGEINREYRVRVFIDDQQSYISEWEKMYPVPKIDKLDLQPFQRDQVKNGVTVTTAGLEVFAQTQDPPEVKNFYRWRWTSAYEIQYSLDDRGPCWVTEDDIDNLLIFEDDIQDGLELNTSIVRLLFGGRTNIQNRYTMKVDQQSLSPSAYDYFIQIKEQRELQGTLFDPTPAPISGNITSTINSEELVVGFFHASASDSETVTIEAMVENAGDPIDCDEFVAANLWRIPGFCYDCTQIGNSSRKKPEWY